MAFSLQSSADSLLQSVGSLSLSLWSLMISSKTMIEINGDALPMNNAYRFSQTAKEQSPDTSATQNVSMWFASDIVDLNSLPPSLREAFGLYAQIDPFIGPLLTGQR